MTIVPPPGVATCTVTPLAASIGAGGALSVPLMAKLPGLRTPFFTFPKLSFTLLSVIAPAFTTDWRAPRSVCVESEF
jgi:hypothetical protein